jgi:hypothetical protein
MIWNIYAHFIADAQVAIVIGVVAHALCGGWG